MADTVLEQARGTDDQWHLADLVEHLLQTLVMVGGKAPLLKRRSTSGYSSRTSSEVLYLTLMSSSRPLYSMNSRMPFDGRK